MAWTIPYHLKKTFEDFARPNRFVVQITPPQGLTVENRWAYEGVMMNCYTSSLPGFSFGTFEHRTKGPLEKFPNDAIYEDVSMGFYVDDSMNSRIFFEEWMNLIYNPQTYNFGYRDEYSTDIIISQLGVDNISRYSVRLVDAYPTQLGEISLSYEDENTIETFDTQITYRYWDSELQNEAVTNFISNVAKGIKAYNTVEFLT